MKQKPPLGLMPRIFLQEERFTEVCNAIKRYFDANLQIPIAWVEEYNELVEVVTNEKG